MMRPVQNMLTHSGFGALQKLGLPLRDLRGVDIELGGELGQRLLASDGF